jgi:hypothetical protein
MSDENKNNIHRDELIAARNSLAEKLAAREQLDIEIAKEQRRIAALTALVNESEEIDELLNLNLGGLTDAVRSVFMASSSYGLIPKEVRDRLVHLYFPVNEYRNFMASLHTVLSRLNKGGEIKLAIRDRQDGRDESVYQWIPKYTHPADGMSLASDLKKWHLGDDKPKTLTHSLRPGTIVDVSKKKK